MAREDWAGRGKQRRIFSQQFKLQVLDSYRRDSDCRGNQRATARKYGIHRRQIQKWLQVEATLRGGKAPASVGSSSSSTCSRSSSSRSTPSPPPTVPGPLDFSNPLQATDPPSPGHYSLGLKVELVDYCRQKCCASCPASEDDEEPILVVDEPAEECLDLSCRRSPEIEPERRTILDLDKPQETALCLVTRSPSPSPPAWPPLHPCHPLAGATLCCDSCPQSQHYPPPPPPPVVDLHWPPHPYYFTSCVTKWLHHDAPYYKQAVKDINLYTPLYS